MQISWPLIPQKNIDEYGLERKIYKGFKYCDIQKGIYGLPQAGKLANTILEQRLATFRYIECMHTTGLWRHILRPVQFKLVVDNFGVKFVGVEKLQHLVELLKKFYEIVLDPRRKKILRNNAGMGLRKYNSWPKYSKLRSYKAKGVWPPQAIKTATWAAQSATTFFQFTKTCTCRRLTPIFKKTHKTYTTDHRIFLILWTGDRPNYNQNPQHIGD